MALTKPKPRATETKATKAEIVEDETVTAEVEEQEQETQPEQTTAVATRTTGTTAAPVEQSRKSLEASLAEDGFEGMEVGYRSYITVKLPAEGVFTTSEEEELGKSIMINLIRSKRKFVYNRDDDDEQAIFSYDQVLTTTGESLEDALDIWKAEGAKITEKHYLDVEADILDGELEGETVMLSVAPASVQKLTGYMGKLKRKGMDARTTVTEAYVMDKVKTKAGKTFYPWGFHLGK